MFPILVVQRSFSSLTDSTSLLRPSLLVSIDLYLALGNFDPRKLIQTLECDEIDRFNIIAVIVVIVWFLDWPELNFIPFVNQSRDSEMRVDRFDCILIQLVDAFLVG